MCSLSNKRIILGVTGGIAAYKSAEIIRRLQDQGAEVRVVMTAAAEEFIRPLTMQALSGNPVHSQLLDSEAEAGMGHIELARWADLLLIAPASADFIANMVHGRADSLLSAIHLATPAIVAVAPAMNQAMWAHAASVANISMLQERGVCIIGLDEGIQACGDVGPGRMQQPDAIVHNLGSLFQTGRLAGKKLVITAGPTREALDPVRYISNHSSGKQGYALAAAAADAGAHVILVSGPTNLTAPDRVELIQVISAQDMHEAVQERIALTDVFIGVAAVADYRPKLVQQHKIKKDQNGQRSLTLELVENPDVIAEVAMRADKPFTIGFAAETEQVEAYARKKLIDKQLDMIVANNVGNTEIGFNSDVNAITVYFQDRAIDLPTMSKRILSEHLVELISQQLIEAL